jgi:membrane protein implicated in regulation of membrane protease activity
MIPSTMLTPDGRRAWSFLALCGAGMTFTLFGGAAMWLVRDHPDSVLWLGLSSLALVFVVLSALSFLLGRRMVVSVSRDGLTLDDREHRGDGL